MIIRAEDGFARLMSDHVKNEYSTLDWIMRGMIERAGLDVIRTEHMNRFYGLYAPNDNKEEFTRQRILAAPAALMA